MSGHISYILNADSWNLVGNYMGLAECALKLDKVLNDDVKSEGFKAHVQKWSQEHDRNLRIFWNSLCLASTHDYNTTPTFHGKLLTAIDAYPRWFEASDIVLLKANGDRNDTSEALACIRRIINNPRVKEHLFPSIKRLTYCGRPDHLANPLPPAIELQPSYFIPEFALLTNLSSITLNQIVYHDGMGNFITPIDFQYVPHVYNFIIKPRTDLRTEDLILARDINIRSKWVISDYDETRWFLKPLELLTPTPSPTFWENIASCFQNIFAWLCSWF